MNHISSAPDGGLFQSKMWKEFQEFLGKEIFETPFFWGVLQKAPVLGVYGEVSRGPAQSSLTPEELKVVIITVAREKKLSLLRIEPQHDSLIAGIQKAGLQIRKAPLDAQPREILMFPLVKSEEEIFAEMKSKTRYNIRLAQKKGIIVRPVANENEEAQFLELLLATARRKNISFHKKEYYQKFIQFFSQEKGTTLVAVKDGRVLAGSVIVFYENTAYYVHGGSSDEGRNAMAPHLLQWEQIRMAKTRGCTQYDFGGVSIQKSVTGKDWGGITRFKQGFAPSTESLLLPGTYDIIFSPVRYYSYQALTRLKNLFL